MPLPVITVRSKALSTTWPWTTGLSPEQIVQRAQELGCNEICIRAVDGRWLYGINDWTRSRWNGKDHRDLAKAAREAVLTVSIWCAVYLNSPEAEADAIREAVTLYDPTICYLDAEAQAKKNIQRLQSFLATASGLPREAIIERSIRGIASLIPSRGMTAETQVIRLEAFLRRLGRLEAKVALQSYRRADYHQEMNWPSWYGFKDATTGKHVIDELGHQLYPIGWDTEEEVVADFDRALNSHQVYLRQVGRDNMSWNPTLPTFIGSSYEGSPGWRLSPEAFMAGLEFLAQTLGERLAGINLWSFDRHLYKMPELAKTITENIIVSSQPPPLGTPFLDLPEPERWEIVRDDLKSRGVIDQ